VRDWMLDHLTPPGEPDAMRLEAHAFAHDRRGIREGVLVSPRSGRWWWIADGVPRLLSCDLYRPPHLEDRYAADIRRLGLPDRPDTDADGAHHAFPRRTHLALHRRTIDRFGDEWLRFRDWGYLDEAPRGDDAGYRGGLWTHTLGAFRGKTFLEDKLVGRVGLDAGCGNGRFTKAALEEGCRRVLAADLGWGVDATRERFADDERVGVVQANLFELPVRGYDAAWSIGVLMHTGDARRAFDQIAAGLDTRGLFAVRMYHTGNAVYETLDRIVRAATTRLNKPAQLAFSRAMASLGRAVHTADSRLSDGTLKDRAYRLFHTWPTLHHNVDWWSAPIATHHTLPEVLGWASDAGLTPIRTSPDEPRDRYRFWEWPEALTALFEKQTVSAAAHNNQSIRPPTAPASEQAA